MLSEHVQHERKARPTTSTKAKYSLFSTIQCFLLHGTGQIISVSTRTGPVLLGVNQPLKTSTLCTYTDTTAARSYDTRSLTYQHLIDGWLRSMITPALSGPWLRFL